MRWKLLFIGIPAVLTLVLLGVWLSTPDVTALKNRPPEETAFMRLRREEAEEQGRKLNLRRAWRPLSQISKNLQHAVIVAEDAAFYEHDGVDVDEMRASFMKNLRKRKLARGGSTITQQLAKNLYLSPSRNPIRKLRELAIALELEEALGKDRILELYLNSIEWGDGIFGAEAAARAYFGTSAARLGEAQAATLAALIPNPRRFAKQIDGKRVQKKKNLILRRMRRRFGPEAGQPADDEKPRRGDAKPAVLKARPLPALAEPPEDEVDDLDSDDPEEPETAAPAPRARKAAVEPPAEAPSVLQSEPQSPVTGAAGNN